MQKKKEQVRAWCKRFIMHVGVCSKSAETAPAGALNSNLTASSGDRVRLFSIRNTPLSCYCKTQRAIRDANLRRNNELSWRAACGSCEAAWRGRIFGNCETLSRPAVDAGRCSSCSRSWGICFALSSWTQVRSICKRAQASRLCTLRGFFLDCSQLATLSVDFIA